MFVKGGVGSLSLRCPSVVNQVDLSLMQYGLDIGKRNESDADFDLFLGI